MSAEKTEVAKKTSGRNKAEGTWGIYPKSISRIETLKYAAWFVRVYYAGQYERQTFNDNYFGGKDNALQEALQWRDEAEKRLGKPRTERSVRKIVGGSENVGIYRRNAKHVKRGKVYYRDIYEVTWSEAPGKGGRTTISVTKHGEEKALRMAQEIRRTKEIELFGGVIYPKTEK